MRVDDSASGREVRLAIGDPLDLALIEVPTTGYAWRPLASGAPVLRLEEDAFAPPAHAVPGAPGLHTWRYRAVEHGTGTLELHYLHSYEAGPPERRFVLRIVVS
jgi:predicted secreted protein